MAEPVGPPPATAARLIHLVLCSGLLVLAGVMFYAQRSRTPATIPVVVLVAPLVVGATMFSGALLLRSRLLDEVGGDINGWWRANLPRAILVWSLFEGPALFGLVIYFVSGQPIALAAPVIGVVLLVFHSPDRLYPS